MSTASTDLLPTRRATLFRVATFERYVVAEFRRTFIVRSALAASVSIALSHAVLMALADADGVRLQLLRTGVMTLSLVGTVGAFVYAGNRVVEVTASMRQLFALRGVLSSQRVASDILGGAILTAQVVAVPVLGLGLVRFGLSPDSTLMMATAHAVLGLVLYVLVYSVTLSVLATAARALAPGRGKLMLAALLVVPSVARVVSGGPHIPGMLSELLNLCLGLSGTS